MFHEILISFGFKENIMDQCIYLKINVSKIYIIVLYVDDMLLASNNMRMIYKNKQFLFSNFDMKDLSETSYVIVIEIHWDMLCGLLGLSKRTILKKFLKDSTYKIVSTMLPLLWKMMYFMNFNVSKLILKEKQMKKNSLCFYSMKCHACSSLHIVKHNLCSRYAWSMPK